MKKTFDALVVAISITLVLGLMLSSVATAEEGTCYLKADRDVYIKVFDYDDGHRGGILWQGRLNEGKTLLLKAPHGQFSYEYNDQPDVHQPLDSAGDRMCNSNKTIGVP